ncbi:Mu transposase C-terminal domain-containing protein [Neobacillus terrae]|uniref:Mu transposase C-terminal domain-containing protein n=1 Tax=Neobacillus terrae TaxID=3034837 RepID=UPI00140C2E1A|nr:Mu transposase C-terminal domain-containing protein [Neobacillus terrae]NHM32434.1 transposase [Neobacillus terrae]
MINDTEYVVRKDKITEIEVENLSYKKIETWSIQELLKLWENNKLIFKVIKGNEYESELPDYALIPENLRSEAERRLKILQPVLTGEVLQTEIKSYVASLPESEKICVATFYNWKKRYNRSNNDIRSLISRNDLKGPRERWSNEFALKKAEEVLGEFLHDPEYETMDSLYSEYLIRMDEMNEFRIEKIKPVSDTTFWRIKQDVLDLEKTDKNQYGRVQAALNRNGSVSKVVVHRPLERVEIDWTPVDVLLVDPKTLKPRRPWLVYALDKYSGHPLGFFVTFNDINAKALKQCLLHCLMPKTYIEDIYPFVENKWLASGKPELLVLDNSKVNESWDVKDACQQLGIEILFCPVDSGNVKGSIERAFRTLNTKVFHGLMGTTFSNTFQRGRYDSEGKAYLTMQSFIYICHIAMVDLVANDINIKKRATPKELWIQGLEGNPEIRPTLSRTKAELKLILMSGLEYRTITNKGIAIKNENYTSPELMTLRHAMRTKGKEKEKVRVRYDLADMRSIFVYNEEERRYIEAFNKDLDEKGFLLEYPVPYDDLQWDSTMFNKAKEKRDRRLLGRAKRKIRLIQVRDRRKYFKYRRMKDEEVGITDKSEGGKSSYHGISTEGLSHIQLNTPEAAETIAIIKDELQDSKKQQPKKQSKKKKKGKSEERNEESKLFNISSSFDIDLEDLPEMDVKYKGV